MSNAEKHKLADCRAYVQQLEGQRAQLTETIHNLQAELRTREAEITALAQYAQHVPECLLVARVIRPAGTIVDGLAMIVHSDVPRDEKQCTCGLSEALDQLCGEKIDPPSPDTTP